MAKETAEERRKRIQKEVAEASAARREAYFKAQEEAKAGAAAKASPLPAADAYKYSYIWRQDVAAPTGEQVLIKNVNPYYDAVTNTILDPATGERKPATQSMFSGPSRIRAGGTVTTDPNAKDPKTGLTLAQTEAAAALAAAKGVNTTLAAALGATVDPKTGKIIASTIDPAKAATWYASQNPNTSVSTVTPVVTSTSTVSTTPTGLDSATSDLIKSLQAQIAALTTSNAEAKAAEKLAERQSAFDLLRAEMDALGLAALVEPLRGLIQKDVSPAEFAIQLRQSEAYKARFIANEGRLKKGLRVLTPGEYLRVEDAYRQTLRTYGLKQFDNDQYVSQFIENDISAAELSDRVATAVQRVQNADPAISRTLRDYYGIGQTDLVAYVLDPNQQLQKIQRQVAAAEIGVAARKQGLEAGVTVAEQLAAQGITEAQAQKGYATIADILPTAEKLSQIYKSSLEGYDQSQAEQEVFNQLASAQRRRGQLVQREVAQFSGQSGLGRGSLGTATGGQY